MKKLVYRLSLLFLMSSSVNAGEYLINKQQYFSSLHTSCNIQLYRGSSLSGFGNGSLEVNVNCGNGKGGHCEGSLGKIDGDFYCSTFSRNRKIVRGANNAINWILNNM